MASRQDANDNPIYEILSRCEALLEKLSPGASSERKQDCVSIISEEFTIPAKAFETLMSLTALMYCSTVRTYIQQNSERFRILSRNAFLHGIYAEQSSREFLKGDLFLALASHGSLKVEEDISKTIYKLGLDAMNLCKFFFLTMSVFASSLCGWFSAYEDLTVADDTEVFNLFCSKQWSTDSMQSQYGFTIRAFGMRKGWYIIPDIILTNLKALQYANRPENVSGQDVTNLLDSWIYQVVQKVLLWMLQYVDDRCRALEEDDFTVAQLSACVCTN